MKDNPLSNIDPLGLLSCTCLLQDFHDISPTVKMCRYSCTAKCSNGTKISAVVEAPGYSTGQGNVCDGAVVATQPGANGQLASYAKRYDPFTIDPHGIIDWFYYPTQLRDGLKQAERGKCYGN